MVLGFVFCWFFFFFKGKEVLCDGGGQEEFVSRGWYKVFEMQS